VIVPEQPILVFYGFVMHI